MTVNYLVCNIEGQKHYHYIRAFALTGRINPIGIIPQGVALGYVQILPFQGASGNAGQLSMKKAGSVSACPFRALRAMRDNLLIS